MLPGGDFSVWDGDAAHVRTLNWEEYTWVYAWIKVSEGKVLDPMFPRQWAAARGRTLRGPYHFFRPFVDPKQSVIKVLEFLGDDLGELPMALDIEVTDDRTDVLTRAKSWLSWYEEFTGRRPIIYSRTTFIRDVLKCHLYPYLANYKIWLAQYPFDGMENKIERDRILAAVLSGERVLKFPPPPFPFNRVCLWQWTALGKPAQVPGYYIGLYGKKEIDINLYPGTELDLIDEFSTGPVPAPAPDNGDPMTTLYGEVLTGLNIRSGPGTGFTVIGGLRIGDKVTAESENEVNGWWKLTSIKRGGQALDLPGPVCYAYEGATNGYIRILPPPTPTPTEDKPKKVTVEMESGKVFVADQFNEQA